VSHPVMYSPGLTPLGVCSTEISPLTQSQVWSNRLTECITTEPFLAAAMAAYTAWRNA